MVDAKEILYIDKNTKVKIGNKEILLVIQLKAANTIQ